MMQQFLKLSVFLFILTILGCETLSEYRSTSIIKKASNVQKQEQIQRLLRQSKRYDELSNKQRHAACKRLKQDYKKQANWQTAWLLVYTLNDDFNCVKKSKTLKLLKAIKADQGTSTQLQWLNNNQILLLKDLDNYKTKNNNLRKQLKKVHIQLKLAQNALKLENSKIEALKAIETNINKKLDNE